MKAVEEHRVSGFCCHRVASDEKYQTPPEVYSGKNVMDRFYEHVVKAAEIIGEIVRQELDMSPMTPQQELDFQKPTHCRNCNTPLSPTSHKVRHHCHVSGRYLFPCCNKCTLLLWVLSVCPTVNCQNTVASGLKMDFNTSKHDFDKSGTI